MRSGDWQNTPSLRRGAPYDFFDMQSPQWIESGQVPVRKSRFNVACIQKIRKEIESDAAPQSLLHIPMRSFLTFMGPQSGVFGPRPKESTNNSITRRRWHRPFGHHGLRSGAERPIAVCVSLGQSLSGASSGGCWKLMHESRSYATRMQSPLRSYSHSMHGQCSFVGSVRPGEVL